MSITAKDAGGSRACAETGAAAGITPSRRVDVIVPCYNYGRFLPDCVGSILAQQGCEVRILIIDDASTDDSLAIAHGLAAADPRIEVRAHAANRGHIATFNEGLDWASADYVLLLSSDDMLAPEAFARAIGLMEENPRISFVYGRSIRFRETADRQAAAAARSFGAPPVVESGLDFIRKYCAAPVNIVETATAVVRGSLQKQVGRYRPELPHSGDMEMWLRLAARGDVGIVAEVQAFTRIHGKNMHLDYKADRDFADFQQRRLVFETFFATEGRDLRERRTLEATTWRSLAEELLWAAAGAFEAGEPASLVARLIAEAKEICPAITRSALWWKVRLRRLLGARFWCAIRAARGASAGPVRDAAPA